MKEKLLESGIEPIGTVRYDTLVSRLSLMGEPLTAPTAKMDVGTIVDSRLDLRHGNSISVPFPDNRNLVGDGCACNVCPRAKLQDRIARRCSIIRGKDGRNNIVSDIRHIGKPFRPDIRDSTHRVSRWNRARIPQREGFRES